MSYFSQIEHAAKWYDYNLNHLCSNGEPVAGYDWSNTIYSSHKIRRAHVEHYKSDKLAVLHVTVFPHLNDAAPIFGLDIVSTNDVCLAGFLDLSPTVAQWGKLTNHPFKVPHSVPEWAASIFSKDAVAIKPTDMDELFWLINLSTGVFRNYYQRLGTEPGNPGEVKSAQNNYCVQQRKNDKTLIALTKMIGAERARAFMDEVLFPLVD